MISRVRRGLGEWFAGRVVTHVFGAAGVAMTATVFIERIFSFGIGILDRFFMWILGQLPFMISALEVWVLWVNWAKPIVNYAVPVDQAITFTTDMAIAALVLIPTGYAVGWLTRWLVGTMLTPWRALSK